MNREKFKHIARSSKAPDTTDIVDLVEITKEFPYFSWGFALLAKIYNDREDFRTETLMHQAALRVSDREWLYNYIHGTSELESTVVDNIETPNIVIPTAESFEAETPNIVITPAESFEVETIEVEIPTSESFEAETQKANDQDLNIQVTETKTPAPTVNVPISTESSNSNEKTNFIETRSTPTLEDLKSAFLKSQTDTRETLELDSDSEANETSELDSDSVANETSELDSDSVANETSILESDTHETSELDSDSEAIETSLLDSDTHETSELESKSKIEEEMESPFFQPVFEMEKVSDSGLSETDFIPSTFEPEITSPEAKKTKGYYNIEDYYTLPPESYNDYQFKVSSKENEPQKNQRKNSTNDFYSWLNSDVPQNAPAVKPIERREDLLDKFLRNKPEPTRPKQEFYSPEKAGKRSDTLSNKLVTETLANIYYKQGNFSKAIDAYQQLQLKFPEKMSYFANLIEKIKKESIS